MEKTFKRFLVGYVAAGHTTTEEAMKELNTISKEFVKTLKPDYLFTSNAVEMFEEVLEESISEENKGFFGYKFDKWRYIQLLEDWIRHLIETSDREQA